MGFWKAKAWVGSNSFHSFLFSENQHFFFSDRQDSGRPRHGLAQTPFSFLFSENQHFLKEVIDGILEGQGVGWLKLSRVKKLMEDENYRNFVVSRLNRNMERKLVDDVVHIEDVNISKSIFKGVLKMLLSIIQVRRD